LRAFIFYLSSLPNRYEVESVREQFHHPKLEIRKLFLDVRGDALELVIDVRLIEHLPGIRSELDREYFPTHKHFELDVLVDRIAFSVLH